MTKVTTYRHVCRCGKTSPGFDSKQKSRDWLASHHRTEGCVSRSTARALLDDVEFKARLASARRFKKIPLPSTPAETVEWHDSSFDAWGAPAQRQVVAKAWGGGNCLKGCIASILGAAIDRVPDPSDFSEDWLDRYSQRLATQTGYRLEQLPAHACPPRSAHQLWIATIDERPDPSDHCVVARGAFVVHDPSGTYQGSLPMHRLVDGLLVVPTKRLVPVFRLPAASAAV